MVIRILVTLFLLFGVTSCLSAGKTAVPEKEEYEFLVIPNNVDKKFKLLLLSKSDSSICISVEDWPLKGGLLDFQNDPVYVKYKGEKYNFVGGEYFIGHCFAKECVYRIEPNEYLEGSILYSDFDLPFTNIESDFALVMPLYPAYC